MALLETTKDLGQLLLEEKLITEEQLQAARNAQATQEKSIGRILVEMGLISEQAKMTFLHKKFNIEIVDIRNMNIPREILSRIPRSYAEKTRCVPILEEKNGLVIAMEDPVNIVVLDEIKAQTGANPIPVLAPLSDIERALRHFPALSQAQADAVQREVEGSVWWRIAHTLLFFVLMLAPLIGVLAAVKLDDQFGNRVARLGTPFDVTIYLVLAWSLWSIILWEIDGLVLGRETSTVE